MPFITNSTTIRLTTANNNLAPGIYDIDSSAVAFDLSLRNVIGTWIFHNTNKSLAINAVTLKSPGSQTFTDTTGVQVDADFVMNLSKVVTVLHTEIGDNYRISIDDGVVTPSVFTPNGSWNASTNTPNLNTSTNRVNGSTYYVYYVNVGGTFNLGTGPQLFESGGRIEWFSSTVYNYLSPSTTSTPLTYGRVNASADLANISFVTTGSGTKIPFNATVYNNGTTFSGTDSIIPSQAGRYRISWFMLAGSGLFNGDGTFHVVQNGVSLGSIFVDMMEAAGVNQISNFIDVNLVAGQAVELRYKPVVADAVAWGQGSYFDVTQLPTTEAHVVNTSNLPVVDQSASGYFDIGTMRLQWGSHSDGNVDTTTATLPALFANINYIVSCTSNNGIAGSCSIESKTTSSFDIDRASTTTNLNIWGWIAIGLKP